jgi:dUTP pyrophosphatase
MTVLIKRLTDTAMLPTRAHVGDAGLDLHADDTLAIPAGEWRLVKTGLAIATPVGYASWVCPRSGLALKQGVTVLNAPGNVDAGYRGELGVILVNHASEPFKVVHGERIAQLVITPVLLDEFHEVDELPPSHSSRGAGGFGSTGK